MKSNDFKQEQQRIVDYCETSRQLRELIGCCVTQNNENALASSRNCKMFLNVGVSMNCPTCDKETESHWFYCRYCGAAIVPHDETGPSNGKQGFVNWLISSIARIIQK